MRQNVEWWSKEITNPRKYSEKESSTGNQVVHVISNDKKLMKNPQDAVKEGRVAARQPSLMWMTIS